MLKLSIRYVQVVILVFLSSIAIGQDYSSIEINDDDDDIHIFDCYQTYFIDDDVEFIDKVEIDGKQIGFEFIPDKKQLILHDYKGKGRINCHGVSRTGEKKEYSKSPCYIDPCDHAL